MSGYFNDSKQQIIVWSVVGAFFLVFLVCCYLVPPATPIVERRGSPADVHIELRPLSQAHLPAPVYQEHQRDLPLPDNVALEKRSDGYYYPDDWRLLR